MEFTDEQVIEQVFDQIVSQIEKNLNSFKISYGLFTDIGGGDENQDEVVTIHEEETDVQMTITMKRKMKMTNKMQVAGAGKMLTNMNLKRWTSRYR